MIVCVCVYVCGFIEIYITAHSGPVILSHSMPLALKSSQGGINDTCYDNFWSDATKETCSLCFSPHLSHERLALPSLIPFYYL